MSALEFVARSMDESHDGPGAWDLMDESERAYMMEEAAAAIRAIGFLIAEQAGPLATIRATSARYFASWLNREAAKVSAS